MKKLSAVEIVMIEQMYQEEDEVVAHSEGLTTS